MARPTTETMAPATGVWSASSRTRPSMTPAGNALCCERGAVCAYAAGTLTARSANAAAGKKRLIRPLRIPAGDDLGAGIVHPQVLTQRYYGVTVKLTDLVIDWLFVLSVIFISTL